MIQVVKSFVPPSIRQAIKKGSRILTGSLRLMPDFIVIGGQKCGTTSLYHYLEAHPYIVSPTEKQMHFFDNNFDKGLTWYRTHFPSYIYRYYFKQIHKQRFITGEATPYYIFHPVAPQRIAKMLPDAKFILLLRNPVDRAYSHYHHEVRKGTETLSFLAAIAKEPERLAGEKEKMLADTSYYSFNYQRYSYLARGIYADQLAEWLKYFPLKQLLVIKSEDMYADANAIVHQILTFLNVPQAIDFQLPTGQYYNVGKYEKMGSTVRTELEAYFQPHNERLYQLLGRNLGW